MISILIPSGILLDTAGFDRIHTEAPSADWFRTLQDIIAYCEKKNVSLTLYSAPMTIFQTAGSGNYDDYIQGFNKHGQYVISKFDKKKNDGILSQFRADHLAQGSGRARSPSTLTQAELPKLLSKSVEFSSTIVAQPVDLMFFNPKDGKYKLFEIKAGGDLDSSNAPKNVEKMLKIYSSLGKSNANLYFATLYHKDGEGKTWTGVVKRHLSEESILIGKKFWEQILGDISFEQYQSIYQNAFEDTGFNDTLSDLINKTAGKSFK